MALKDLLRFVDDKLADTFTKKPFDVAKARAALIKGIQTTRNQFASATPVKGRKAFKVQNGIVGYVPGVWTPELRAKAVDIGNGVDGLLVPSEKFNDFLNGLEATANDGELDKALEDREAAGGTPKAAGGAPKATGAGGGAKRSGWSEARRAAHEARMAAKKGGGA